MKRSSFLLLLNFIIASNILEAQNNLYTKSDNKFQLTEEGAAYLSSLPLRCLDKPFPYKTGITFLDSSQIVEPKNYHPAFFGCYDWHSSVHGHWMLIKLLKEFPNLRNADAIRSRLAAHLTAENIKKEIAIFTGDNQSFERTYGWCWLLYLQRELLTWNDPWAKQLADNIQPLADYFSAAWIKYLDKIVYPIRVGEHTNLAFGLSFTLDYAVTAGDTALQNAIRKASFRFFKNDKSCPASWEPGGSDFLSPCLEEARLMSKLLSKDAFYVWLKQFMPGLLSSPSSLFKIAEVKDRTDGKLVHLDGLNFSRAACLYQIAAKLPPQYSQLIRQLAAQHLQAALPHVVSGSYAGEHWLGSFAVYALSQE
jgi:hypothetical protein